MQTAPTDSRTIWKLDAARRSEERDELAVEEPLEIRVAGEPLAVTMRSPGQDEWLAAGFLLSEGIIGDLGEVSRIYHCGRPGTEEYRNTIDVIPAAGHTLDLGATATSKRGTLTTAACGVCGRRSINDLVEKCQLFGEVGHVSAEIIRNSIRALRDQQPTFARTGGVHAAGVYNAVGELLACCEDLGRHNAVDKAVGALMYSGEAPAKACLLAVGGRASFEMVQKAAMARIPFLASASAASTLAVSLADRLGMTLVGFVRGETMNLYTHAERIS